MAEIKYFEFTPVLGWSATRYDVFSICKRQYYYAYYGKQDPKLPAGLVGKYKALVSIPIEIGGIVHEAIGVLLHRLTKATETLDRAKFFDYARRISEHHLRVVKFQEVVYGEQPPVTLDDVYPKVQQCLENLLTSNRYQRLTTAAALTASEWIIDPSGYGETRFDGLKLYCKVDFLFPVDGRFCIMDWKTGGPDPEKHRRQMVGYAAWACYHFQAVPESMRPILAYLYPAYREVQETFNDFDLEDFSVQVRAQTEQMYAYCADHVQNVPLEIDHFPMRNDPRTCVLCKYRGLCDPNQYCANFLST